MTTTNCDLYHHGILGQRWGVRRTPAQLGRASSSSSYRVSRTSGRAKKSTSSSTTKKMTNEELNSIIRRMELEKRYRDLNPKKVSKGKKFVNTVINKAILPAATEASKQILKDYLVSKGSEAMGIKTKKK